MSVVIEWEVGIKEHIKEPTHLGSPYFYTHTYAVLRMGMINSWPPGRGIAS